MPEVYCLGLKQCVENQRTLVVTRRNLFYANFQVFAGNDPQFDHRHRTVFFRQEKAS